MPSRQQSRSRTLTLPALVWMEACTSRGTYSTARHSHPPNQLNERCGSRATRTRAPTFSTWTAIDSTEPCDSSRRGCWPGSTGSSDRLPHSLCSSSSAGESNGSSQVLPFCMGGDLLPDLQGAQPSGGVGGGKSARG